MLQVPGLESEIGLEACRFLSSAAVNKRLVAIVEVLLMPRCALMLLGPSWSMRPNPAFAAEACASSACKVLPEHIQRLTAESVYA